MMSLLEKSVARENLPPNGAKIVGAGGAGYKVLCLLDGLADSYIYPAQGVMRWDTCAPEAILRSLNGSLTDIFNRNYNYDERRNDQDNVVAAANVYGIIASLSETNLVYANCLVDELKELVNDEAAKYLASRKLNN